MASKKEEDKTATAQSAGKMEKKEPKDLRYRRLHFPNAEKLVFTVDRKGYAPVPIIQRKLLKHLTQPEVRLLLYLQLRISKHGICYPSLDEVVHELGLTSRKNLVPHIAGLERKKCISTKNAAGKTFFLVHDPRHALQELARNDEITETELSEINDLLEDLKQPLIQKKKQATAAD